MTATAYWLNGLGGNWFDLADWSIDPNLNPVNAVIDAPPVGTGYQVDVSGPNSAAYVLTLSLAVDATLWVGNEGSLYDADGTGAGANAGTIDIGDDSSATIGGPIDNAGRINIRTNASLAVLGSYSVDGSGPATLDGGGSIVLAGTGGTSLLQIYATSLVNIDNTISGQGTITGLPLELDNLSAGVIDAVGSSPLVLDLAADSLSNAGLLEATLGAGLRIDTSGTLRNVGTILADGASVSLSGTSSLGLGIEDLDGGVLEAIGPKSTIEISGTGDIIGGTVETSRGGIISIASGAFVGLDGPITLTGSVVVQSGGTAVLFGHIVNQGTILLVADLEIGTVLYVPTQLSTYPLGAAPVTLSGGGVVDLGGAGAIADVGGLVNLNDTITGGGIVFVNPFQSGSSPGVEFDNQADGVIDASAGETLDIFGNDELSNEGLMEATPGGVLDIGEHTTTTIDNTGVIASRGGTVALEAGAAILGGTLLAEAGVVIFINSDFSAPVTLSGISLTAGSLLLGGGSSWVSLAGTIDNAGNINVGGGLIISGSVILAGHGVIELGSSQIVGATLGDTLVNLANTIQGDGLIGTGLVSLDNRAAGVIMGDDFADLTIDLGGGVLSNAGQILGSGPGMVIQDTTLTNTGTIGVSRYGDFFDPTPVRFGSGAVIVNVGLIDNNGSQMVFQDATLTNTGTILAAGATVQFDPGSVVTNLDGGALRGGTWIASAGGTIAIDGIAPLITDAAGIVLSGGGSAITVDGTAIETSLTTITTGGTLSLLDSRGYATTNTLSDRGSLVLGGGTLTADALVVSGTLSGYGTVAAPIGGAGTIVAEGGLLTLAGAVVGSDTLVIEAGATLELGAKTAAAASVDFATPSGILRLDAPAGIAATIDGFGGGDLIDLGGAVATGLSYDVTTGILTLTGARGTIAALAFAGSYTQASFSLTAGGTQVADPPAAVTARTIGALSPAVLATPLAASDAPPVLDPTLVAAPAVPVAAAWTGGSDLTAMSLGGAAPPWLAPARPETLAALSPHPAGA